MNFDSLIFDVDGTIWNTTSVVAEAWNVVIEKYFPLQPRVNAEILKGQFGKTMDVIADNLFPTLNRQEKDFLMDKCSIQEQLDLENCNKDLTYNGMSVAIAALSKKYSLFIVSNCQKGYIELVIEKTKIKKFIKDFECFGNNGNTKDKNINLIIERNNLQNPVYIGDTNGDYEACKNANVPFIWASYGFGKTDDENYFAKVESFTELVKKLL